MHEVKKKEKEREEDQKKIRVRMKAGIGYGRRRAVVKQAMKMPSTLLRGATSVMEREGKARRYLGTRSGFMLIIKEEVAASYARKGKDYEAGERVKGKREYQGKASKARTRAIFGIARCRCSLWKT
jgi:hypothetical protein